MLDLDGTTIPVKESALPSERVINAIKKAKEKLSVGIATGRPVSHVKPILEILDLTCPCVINGGASIINPQTFEILYQKLLDPQDVKKIYQVTNKYSIDFHVNEGEKSIKVTKYNIPQKPITGYILGIDEKIADKLIEELSHISTISFHKLTSWTKGKFDVVANHVESTKLHGIQQVAKMLKISTREIIGVGDGYNDFPLLMACGLRIAMGNAVPELKEIADYVSPSVDDDGVADVIEKYILNI